MASWFGRQPTSSEEFEQMNAACAAVRLFPHQRELTFELMDTRNLQVVRNELNAAGADRRNRDRISQNVRNALSSQDGTKGGYTFGETFTSNLEVAMVASSGIMEAADIIRTETGEPMRWPTVNDTSNSGRQIGENGAVTSTAQPTFGQKVWYAHKFTSDEILVPYELLNNNAVGLETVIPELLGERIGRIINSKGTTGSGASTLTGIVTASALGVTGAGASSITFDEVIDLEHSVNRVHRRRDGVGYMFNDTTLKVIRKLKDGNSNYLWQSGANSGAPDTINTYAYIINDDMADLGASAKPVLFGRLKQYKLRMVRRIRVYRLTERHRENDQDAFLAFVEADGNLLNAGDNPVKYFQNAAS